MSRLLLLYSCLWIMCSLYPPLRMSGWVMNIVKSRWLDTNYLMLSAQCSKHKHDVIVCTDSTLPVYKNPNYCAIINTVMLL